MGILELKIESEKERAFWDLVSKLPEIGGRDDLGHPLHDMLQNISHALREYGGGESRSECTCGLYKFCDEPPTLKDIWDAETSPE